MPHSLAQAAALVARVLAFAVGVLAFYLAFFLYEDEDGVWQSRIDNFWVAVDERARVVDSVTTALFNKIGQTLKGVFDGAFGKKLLSIRAFAISANLSLAAGYLSMDAEEFVIPARLRHFSYPLINGHPSPWSEMESGFYVEPTSAILGALVFLSLAYLAYKFNRKSAIFISLLPVTTLLLAMVASLASDIIFSISGNKRGGIWIYRRYFEVQPMVLLVSFLSDYLAIILLRKLFASISHTISTLRILATVTALCVFAGAIWVVPTLLGIWLSRHFPQILTESFQWSFLELLPLNSMTAILCLLPALVLVVVLLHKLLWPTLSRLIYPLCRFAIVTNRKVLVTVGTICFTVGLNLEHVGWRFLLDQIK
jgi:hypothetical protein